VPNDPRICLIVDLANVMGSRPDGWWRDRAGAATRWLTQLDPLVGRSVTLPDGGTATLFEVVVVVEGQARAATGPQSSSLRVVRAERDGDTTVVDLAEEALARVGLDTGEAGSGTGGTESGGVPLVVTADRGLRDRLPPGVVLAGPGWLRRLVE
jgi:hypothetical protein